MTVQQTLEEAEVVFVEMRGQSPHREMVVASNYGGNDLRYELWAEKPDNPSYSLLYEGVRFEFVRSSQSREAL